MAYRRQRERLVQVKLIGAREEQFRITSDENTLLQRMMFWNRKIIRDVMLFRCHGSIAKEPYKNGPLFQKRTSNSWGPRIVADPKQSSKKYFRTHHCLFKILREFSPWVQSVLAKKLRIVDC